MFTFLLILIYTRWIYFYVYIHILLFAVLFLPSTSTYCTKSITYKFHHFNECETNKQAQKKGKEIGIWKINRRKIVCWNAGVVGIVWKWWLWKIGSFENLWTKSVEVTCLGPWVLYIDWRSVKLHENSPDILNNCLWQWLLIDVASFTSVEFFLKMLRTIGLGQINQGVSWHKKRLSNTGL